MQELSLLWAPDKEHKKACPGLPSAKLGNGKSWKDNVTRAPLLKLIILGDVIKLEEKFFSA